MHSCPQIVLPPPYNPAHPISERQDQTFPIAQHMVSNWKEKNHNKSEINFFLTACIFAV